MEYRTLGKTGLKVSVIGYGASPLGNEFGETPAAEGVRAVQHAIDNGINYFDVAPYYGRTLAETNLGNAFLDRRDEIILATKCGRYGMPEDEGGLDFSAERVTRSIDESLTRLKTGHVDVLQIHDIEFADREQIINETLPALRKIQETGKARFIGITSLCLDILRDVAERAEVDTILSYCRYNLMITDLDDVLTPLCKEQGIGLVNASPLHMRILSEKGAPDWHLASQEVKDAGRKVVELCKAEGVSVSDVAMRFCVDHSYAATTLVGMSKQRHVEQNIKSLEYKADAELLKRIAEIVAPVKDQMWPSGLPENYDGSMR